MPTKSISQLETQAIPHDTDLFEVASVDSNSASGYKSGKMSAEVIAEGILNTYTYPTAMPNMQNRTITGAINTLLGNFAPIYDATATYQEGDVVTYQGQLYKAHQDIETSEAFDVTKWDAGTAADFFEGGGGNQISYSTSEQDTGINWIDGKRIYQKTVVFNNVRIANDVTLSHGIDNIDNIVSCEYMMIGPLHGAQTTVFAPITDSDGYLGCNATASQILFYGTTYFSGGTERYWYFTLRYTKTST